MATDEEIEQQRLEDEKVAREKVEAAVKKTEEEAAAKKAAEEAEAKKSQVKPSLSEEQIQKLEKDTGFTRQQLITLNLMQQQVKPAAGAPAKMVEDYAYNSVMTELKSSGIKSSVDLEIKVKEELKKLPEANRQDSDVIKNLFFMEAGKRALGLGEKSKPPAGSSGRILSGVNLNSNPPNDNESKETDISSLSEHEQGLFKKYKFKDMGEWKKYQRRELDTSYEENWQPQFGK